MLAPAHVFEMSDHRWQPVRDSLRQHVGRLCRVLDLGCGDGTLLDSVLKDHPEARGIGVDLTPPARQSERVRYIAADAATYIADEPCDLVLALGLLHLLPGSDREIAARLAAATSPNGWLCFDLPVATLRNRALAGARWSLKQIRSPIVDALLRRAARRVYGRQFDAQFLADRIGYLYMPPTRFLPSFCQALKQHGFEQVHAIPTTRQSAVELDAVRVLCRQA